MAAAGAVPFAGGDSSERSRLSGGLNREDAVDRSRWTKQIGDN